MTFAPDEVERYARHLVLSGVGGPGQARLKAARVTVVGAGGLGAPVLAYLAAAGVGRLSVVDDDAVALSNLQRQILFAEVDVGRPKAAAACERAARANRHVSFDACERRLDAQNARSLVAGSDVVVNGTDNFAAREALAEACEALAIPLVEGGVSGWDGPVTTHVPFEVRPDGTAWPRLSDLFPHRPDDPFADGCERLGVLGVTTGVIGTLQATEAIKLIVGEGEPLRGRLLLYDGRSARFETIAYG